VFEQADDLERLGLVLERSIASAGPAARMADGQSSVG